jgi:hypothetical protein
MAVTAETARRGKPVGAEEGGMQTEGGSDAKRLHKAGVVVGGTALAQGGRDAHCAAF